MARRHVIAILSLILSTVAHGQEYFNLFQPPPNAGVMKGSPGTYITTNAAWQDIVALFNTSSTCTIGSTTEYLRVDGNCAVPAGSGSGSVTEVAFAAPTSIFSCTGGPITGSGTITCTYATGQTATELFGTDGSGNVSLFALTGAYVPPINLASTANGGITGTLGVAHGGLGVATLTAHGLLVGEGTSAVNALTALAADTVVMGQGASADPAGAAVPKCGSGSAALSYSTSTHSFGCQTISSGTGTVTTLTAPSVFSVAGDGTSTLALTFAGSQTANEFLRTPNGTTGALALGSIVSADLPPSNLASSANGGVTGNLPHTNLNGGVGASSATCWHGNDTWGSCGGSISSAPPSALVGLTAITGATGSYMDAGSAPALSQSIAPFWSGTHFFSGAPYTTSTATGGVSLGQSGNYPIIGLTDTNETTNAKNWRIDAASGATLQYQLASDDWATTFKNYLAVTRSAATVTGMAFGNATDNPAYAFLGTGTVSVNGGLTVAGHAVCQSTGTNCPASIPAGTTTQFQYNNAGVLAGTPGITYNNTNSAMSIASAGGGVPSLAVGTTEAVDFYDQANLPAGTPGHLTFVGGSGTPTAGRILWGDGTGWSMYFSRRIGSVTTDLITFPDIGGMSLAAPSSGATITEHVASGTTYGHILSGSSGENIYYNATDGTRNFAAGLNSASAFVGTISSTELDLGTGGSTRVAVGAGGNITVAAPASGSTMVANGLNGGGAYVANAPGFSASSMVWGWDVGISPGAWNLYTASTDPLFVGTAGTGSLTLATNGSTRELISSSGNVVIEAPSAGGVALAVGGTIAANGAVTVNSSGGASFIQFLHGGTGEADVCLNTQTSGAECVVGDAPNDISMRTSTGNSVHLGDGSGDAFDDASASTFTFHQSLINAPSALVTASVVSATGNVGTPSSGSSVDLQDSGGNGYVTSFNHSTDAGAPLILRGSNVQVLTSPGVDVLGFQQFTDGGVAIGSPTSADCGSGCLNAQSMKVQGGAVVSANTAGNVVIPAPTTGNTLSLTGSSSGWTAALTGSSTAGDSNGLLIVAGSNASDFAVNVVNAANNLALFRVQGDGTISFPASGSGMTVGGPSGANLGAGIINAEGLAVNGVRVAVTASPALTGSPTVNGVNVCLANGTNCPGGGSPVKTAHGVFNMAGGTCTITFSGNGIASCTHNTTGDVTVTFTSGFFTTGATCVASDTTSDAPPLVAQPQIGPVTTGTLVFMRTTPFPGTLTDSAFQLICTGT